MFCVHDCTIVSLRLLVVIGERVIMKAEVDLDGCTCCLEVKRMHTQHVLQIEQIDVRTQSHLPHTVCVEVELVIRYLHKMLLTTNDESVRIFQTIWVFIYL